MRGGRPSDIQATTPRSDRLIDINLICYYVSMKPEQYLPRLSFIRFVYTTVWINRGNQSPHSADYDSDRI